MTQATIVIPTHAERPSLELSLRSALGQTVREIEVFVVGDGCPPATSELVQRLMAEDTRLRFFEFPKGERHGEAHRHAALQEARGKIVTYLSDDDLLYPDHVEVCLTSLKDATFMAPRACFVSPDGSVRNYDGDITSARWRDLLLTSKRNFMPLTGVAHTLALYRALEVGWSPAPPDVWTDLFMWRKLMRHTDFRAVNASHITCLVFPAAARDASPSARLDELTGYAKDLGNAEARLTLERRILAERHMRASEHALYREQHALRVAQCENELIALKASRHPPQPAATTVSQTPGRPLFVVSANCYSAGLTAALRAMFPEARIQAAPVPDGSSQLVLDRVRALLRSASVWITRGRHDLAEGLGVDTVTLPSLQFSAFHPDITYARHATTKVLTSQHYNSRIAVWAYRRGLEPYDAARLFTRETYEILGYTAGWQESVVQLRRSFKQAGFAESDADGFVARLKRRGLFMHSHNHPHVGALVELAKMVARRLGGTPQLVDRDVVVSDSLTETIWPLYEEIGECYGLRGSYVWRLKGSEVSGAEAYLTHAFAEYERQGLTRDALEMVQPSAGFDEALTAQWGRR